MVCQAASQTNFRALKHENGIAGSATIIVRVIACFQPLQDCQVIAWVLMGEDRASWFPLQHIDWQPPNSNCLGSQLVFRKHSTAPSIANPEMISVKGTISTQPLEPNEAPGWFYTLPRFQQAFAPALNYGFQGNFPVAPKPEKKFLVFDQSGDQTTLIFGSGTKTPIGHFTSLCNVKTQIPETEENPNIHVGAITADQHDKDSGADLLSEMNEDTDELNALLYSDDDSDCDEGDEVTSTGHSPSTMTVHDIQNRPEDGIEATGSCNGSVKKRKLFEGCRDLQAPMDTASSVKRGGRFGYEDDAESWCENKKSRASDDMEAEPNNKKIRREKIKEAVNVLQSIIPRGKGKDAVVVIDEAINYLKSLKMKAKALGLDAP